MIKKWIYKSEKPKPGSIHYYEEIVYEVVRVIRTITIDADYVGILPADFYFDIGVDVCECEVKLLKERIK